MFKGEEIMKKKMIFEMSVLFTVVLIFSISTVMAAKPLDVIQISNGYPSGPHFNLNIHGKVDFACESTEGGNSVFINEYGESTITYVTNRKSLVTDLMALDTCAEPFDGTPAKVQLPYEALGFWVFAEVKGKPKNGITSEESSVILSPNLVRQACNDTDPANPEFPNYTECPDDELLALGLIVGTNVYEATGVGLVRYEDKSGNGKSTATDITNLFKWTGYVFDAILDINGDGKIDSADVPIDYDLVENGGNGDNIINEIEYDNWLADQEAAGFATYYENEWILNIADLVVTDQTITNDGVKLLKLRFYPVSSTYYE
jgi:hypothetical protein